MQHSKKSWDGLQDASHTWQGSKELWRSEEFAFGTRSAAIFFNADIGSRGVCRGRDVAVLGDEDNLKEFESSTFCVQEAHEEWLRRWRRQFSRGSAEEWETKNVGVRARRTTRAASHQRAWIGDSFRCVSASRKRIRRCTDRRPVDARVGCRGEETTPIVCVARTIPTRGL